MRVKELDALRGIALLTIMLNHYSLFVGNLDYPGPSFPTLSNFGYSSSAELFFLISGYLVGLLYTGTAKPLPMQIVGARLIGRAAYLLAMNCLLFVCVLAIGYWFPNDTRVLLGLDSGMNDPYFAAYHVIRLGYHIPLLGILNFYIIMMIAALPFIYLLKRSAVACLVLIVFLYAVSQAAPWLSLSGGRFESAGLLAFNPLAWQILFMGGIVAGRYRFHEFVRDRVSYSGWFFVAAAAFAGFVGIQLLDRALPGFSMPLIDRQTLGPVRIVHVSVTIVFLLSLLYRLERFKDVWLYRSIGLIGRHSLECFMFGVMLSYVMALAWSLIGSRVGYFAISFAGMAVLYGCAVIFETYKLARKGLLVRSDPVLATPAIGRAASGSDA